MTTERQAAANKSNAKKSSGPKTAGGKAAASRNATKHGLTGRPDWTQVTAAYRIVLEDPDALPDPVSTDRRLRAALALAEADAGLRRAAETERAYIFAQSKRALDKRGTAMDFINVVAELDLEDIDTLDFLIARETDPWMREGLELLKASSPKRPVEVRKTIKRLARYRREAEARRSKALGRWISLNRQNPETNPFSIKG